MPEEIRVVLNQLIEKMNLLIDLCPEGYVRGSSNYVHSLYKMEGQIIAYEDAILKIKAIYK